MKTPLTSSMKPTLTLLTALLLAPLGVLFHALPGFGQTDSAKRPHTIVVTDYPDIHAAVKAARDLGVGRIYAPAGVYVLDKTLDLSGLGWSPLRETAGEKFVAHFGPVTFEGAGERTILIAKTGDTPAIDLSGSHPGMVLRDFVLQTPFDETKPAGEWWQPGSAVGILLSRMSGVAFDKPDLPPTGDAPSSGDHVFHNVTVRGSYATAAVLSWHGELNSFYHCRFQNTMGDGFIYGGGAIPTWPGARSPYRRAGISSNVGVGFYYCSFSGTRRGSVGLRVSAAGDVYVIGGYFGTGQDAFAAIYLDGTVRVQNFILRDVRMENQGGHNLYAAGAVRDVLIEGGEWVSMNSENIRHMERVPNAEGAHRKVSDPRGAGHAANWVIRGLRFSRDFEDDPALAGSKAKPSDKGYVAMLFDGLLDSRIGNISYYVRRSPLGKPYTTREIVADTPMLVVEKYSRRNTFETASREAVELRGDARGNEIIALADGAAGEAVPALWRAAERTASADYKRYDDGIRRQYVSPDGPGSLLNLGPQNVLAIKQPRPGDVALHDGTGFADKQPRLAVYTDGRWRFFQLSPDQPNVLGEEKNK